MGLFPFARTISSMLSPLPQNTGCSHWPEVLWRRSSHPSAPSAPPRLQHNRPLIHPRASISPELDRAPEGLRDITFFVTVRMAVEQENHPFP